MTDSMSPAPLISVVLAAHNGAAYIREQMDSILAQTWPALEIICLDDASTDVTPAILEDYQARNPDRVRFIRNPANLGSRKTFEAGVRLATGRYIAFSDQDDVWFPDKLKTLQTALKSDPGLAFVYSNSDLVNEKLEPLGRLSLNEPGKILEGRRFYRILNHNTVMGCSMLAEASFIRACLPFPPTGLHHDWYLACMALGLNQPIAFVSRPLFLYRRHTSNQVRLPGTGRSHNTTRFRAERSLLELSHIDESRFTNETFRTLVVRKREMFRNILARRPFKAFQCWREFYRLLDQQEAVEYSVKRSNLRYIFYGLFWRKAAP